MRQGIVQYWKLGHRSAACYMEDNMMNSPNNSTCSLCFISVLSHWGLQLWPYWSLPGWEHLWSRTVLQLSQPGRDCSREAVPTAYSHVPFLGHRPFILLIYRTATFSLPIIKFLLNNKTVKSTGSSFDWMLLRLPCHSCSAGWNKPSTISNRVFHGQNAWKEKNLYYKLARNNKSAR